MIYDVIIVGAGAAGLMAAIEAGEGGLKVLLLEGQKKVGAKILMSGGTRCNVTNRAVTPDDYNSGRIIYVRNILRSFGNPDTIKFFKDLGVDLVQEPTGKYFPSTNSGKTVLDAFLRKIGTQKEVILCCEHKVKALSRDRDGFIVKGEGFSFSGKSVVLTTGGLSYPTTGSDGTGYRLAQSFGHSMVDTTPALTPLTTDDKDLKALSGITLDVQLTLMADGKRQRITRDSFLFTHFGFSGPAALDISRHYLRADGPKLIVANFIPGHNESTLQELFRQARQKSPRKTLRAVLVELMPQRLVDVISKKAGIDSSLIMNQLDKKARGEMAGFCVHYPLEVTGVLGYSKAEVTAGGIDWDQVDPKTLGSRLVPGLYFAGEILDVDGRIGGFNFQWAWASGHAVGQALLKNKKELLA